MMAALFGTLMVASCTEMVLSRVLHLARRIITPLVSGIVVMIIGLSLIQVGLTSIGGGYAAMSDHTFGAPKNLLLAGVVLAVIILLNRQRNPYLRVASLVIAMAVGYLLARALGMLPESAGTTQSALVAVPMPLYYGLGFDWNLLIPLMLVFMVTSLETIGDITATSDVSEQPVTGPIYMKRLKGGVLANGLNSFVSALFNTFPNSCFGQNNGVIQLTGVASRYVGFVVSLMLIVLGLFPAVSGFVQHIPEPVLGGATIVMFGTIAASGVRIVSREPLNRRAIMIIALSLAVGLGVSQQPLILQFAPDWLKTLLSSGIAAGGITAIVLNLIFPQRVNPVGRAAARPPSSAFVSSFTTALLRYAGNSGITGDTGNSYGRMQMKFVGKLILSLLLLLLLVAVVCYFLLQTRWGAEWASRRISDDTAYHLSIAKIEHNFSDPSLLSLHNVSFGHDGQPAVMVAKTVNLGLSLSLFNQPLRFASIELRDGTLDAANMPGNMAWPLQADRLQLRNMAVNTPCLPSAPRP